MRSSNGWQYFVCTLLVVIGAINIIQGLTAMFTPAFFLADESRLLMLEYEGWGLLLGGWGVVMVVAGLAILSGSAWARIFGIVLASVNALAQLAFLIAMPLWSAIVIAIDIVVVYGLTAGWPSATRDEEDPETRNSAYRAGYRAAHERPASTPPPTRSPEHGDQRRRTNG
ncbi:hypothetical protein VSQ78_19895 [Nocardiopsis alba]|jgi:hypothetical protein|uniref:DUF7144 domain-containing protein n=1 Tax=Nocardiopsis alba TaxID=53437 RepID=A0A7K2INM3_9ACTN|nr:MULTISPECIES: hypothetical protein [Nocardiopsis]MEC3895447.1 hypothetical protein [Nocardiopsis sp. LDBS1602]MYR31385.1 hypothetical protein [Nocardiopsis alba]